MTEPVRIGLIGCGEAVQLLHLPSLRELPDQFRVTALYDASNKVMDGVARGCPGAKRHGAIEDLVTDPNVDAVVIANPNVWHADSAIAAMRAGKHVLIEKPVCITRNESDTLIEAELRSGVVAQVGTMRRYAPAFVEAALLLADRSEPITLARVHDVIGPNSTFIDSGPRIVIRGDDVPPAIIEQGKSRQSETYLSEIGVDHGLRANAFGLLLGLGTHDTSAMREFLGCPPRDVLYAAARSGGWWITAALDYGEFVCHLEIGLDKIAHFDCHLEAYLPTRVIRVDFDTPYIRHQPTKLSITRMAGTEGVESTTSFSTRNDSFVAEWRAFHESIAGGGRPKCSIADAAEDLALYRRMVAMMS